jgi:signal transduction histidine kinase
MSAPLQPELLLGDILTYVDQAEKLLAEIDHKKISIVIQNLIDNAIKYSNENSVINIETRKINTTLQIIIKNRS